MAARKSFLLCLLRLEQRAAGCSLDCCFLGPLSSFVQEHFSEQKQEYEEKLAAEVRLHESTAAEAQAAIGKLEKELQDARAAASQGRRGGALPDTFTVASYGETG